MNRTEDSSTVLQITAECIVTDPAERQRRLAQVYDLIMDFGRQRRAAIPDASSEEPRPQAGASSKEKAREGCRPQDLAGHSSTATGRGILAFSREPDQAAGSAGSAGSLFVREGINA